MDNRSARLKITGMNREIVLDTETTGFEPDEGHRLVEIGCVELANHLPTGNTYQVYINPDRDVPAEAARIHGLTTEFLKDKPLFTEVVGDFLDFIGEAKLVIHNAEFDMKFINAELGAAGFKKLSMTRVIDTLPMAREKFPGQAANLDALCRRFNIDNSDRKFHGALLDSELLSEVYLELIGGRQHGLGLDDARAQKQSMALNARIKRQERPRRTYSASKAEIKAHEELIDKLKDPLWRKVD